MSCEYCTDPDGKACFPVRGIAPHNYDSRGLIVGFAPREQWPDNYVPDPEDERMGAYFCPRCGDGKPIGHVALATVNMLRDTMLKLGFAEPSLAALGVDLDANIQRMCKAVVSAFVHREMREDHPPSARRMYMDFMQPDGTRLSMRVGQPLLHFKGGRYVLTGFPVRESDMKQGFSYMSIDRRVATEFWRPYEELFDGRFEKYNGTDIDAERVAALPSFITKRRIGRDEYVGKYADLARNMRLPQEDMPGSFGD